MLARAGSGLAGKNGGVVLLAGMQPDYGSKSLQTIQGTNSEGTPAFLKAHARDIYWVDVLGGNYVIPKSLMSTIDEVAWHQSHQPRQNQ